MEISQTWSWATDGSEITVWGYVDDREFWIKLVREDAKMIHEKLEEILKDTAAQYAVKGGRK